MNRAEVITRLKSVEPALRSQGVGSLYLFGSYGRDQGTPESDLDVFVDAADDGLFDLSNFMGAYSALKAAFPQQEIGYSTRDSLSKRMRESIEREALKVF